MKPKQNVRVLLACLAVIVLAGSLVQASDPSSKTARSVVMVCEHGTVKSVIAASLLEREASERGIEIRSISRGLLLDERVPGPISEALKNDGFDVSEFVPEVLTDRDITDAARVISIGADLRTLEEAAAPKLERWDDIPPASVDYEASKAALLRHIRKLLDELEPESLDGN